MSRLEESLNKAFGETLRKARGEASISQEELAARSGLHRTYVSQLERGLKSPSLNVIAGLARSLGVRPHELVRSAEDLMPSTFPAD